MKIRSRILAFLLTGVVVSMSLAGCGSSAADTADSVQTSQPAAAEETKQEESGETEAESGDADLSQKEAPMLAEKVAAGELPALEERLPAAGNEMVEPDVQSLGNYGGSISIRMGDNARWNWGPWTEQFRRGGSQCM